MCDQTPILLRTITTQHKILSILYILQDSASTANYCEEKKKKALTE